MGGAGIGATSGDLGHGRFLPDMPTARWSGELRITGSGAKDTRRRLATAAASLCVASVLAASSKPATDMVSNDSIWKIRRLCDKPALVLAGNSEKPVLSGTVANGTAIVWLGAAVNGVTSWPTLGLH